MLLPYYIASLNIEHAYYERTGEYKSFEGICFADTLELAEGQQPSLFVEENTERVEREKAAPIMVVIGNPPYNVGQMNENDNNKNRRYPVIDERIRETYVKNSKATLHTINSMMLMSNSFVGRLIAYKDAMALFALSQIIHLSTSLPLMVCASIFYKTLLKFIILTCMAMFAKIPNFLALHIMSLAFK